MVNLLKETLSLINEVYENEFGNVVETNEKLIEDMVNYIGWAKVYVKFDEGKDSILVLPPVHSDEDCRKFLRSLEDVKDDNVIYSSGIIFLENSVAWLERTEKTGEVWEHWIVPKFF